MTKIMLVEDDKSLREIYGVRLLAEGYDIVSAGDGEEALAMAIKERPILIITDVMMPRISGFDMLDILRSTTETRGIKVIVMTALSSEDQRKHGEQLGADRYVVKSQVGIEDVVRIVHEVLGDTPAPAAPPPIPSSAPAPPVSTPAATPQPAPQPRPASPAPAAVQPAPAVAPGLPKPAAPSLTPPTVGTTIKPTAPAVASPMPPARNTAPAVPSSRQRIIQPLNDPTAKIDINNLLDKELAREAGVDVNNRPAVATTQQERDVIAGQLQSVAPPTAIPVQAPPADEPDAPVVQPVAVQQTAPAQPQPAAPRPPVQAPPRPNIAPIQPRPTGTPPAPTV